jgi:hypothetical protein
MVTPSAGSVVLVAFPFSDLSASKLRPAVVLASAGLGDWILCQVTSNSYSDARAIRIEDADFCVGALQRVSFARPGPTPLRRSHGRAARASTRSIPWSIPKENSAPAPSIPTTGG